MPVRLPRYVRPRISVSATLAGAPVPSTTRAPRMRIVSWAATAPLSKMTDTISRNMQGILTRHFSADLRGDVGLIIKANIAFRPRPDDLSDMDILLAGGALALSGVATLLMGKVMLRGFVSVLERRGRL